MKFTELGLASAYVIELERRDDARGFFARTFCAREFAEYGLLSTVAQCNTSFSLRRGTVRGMHYQVTPHEEAKLVRCTTGAIVDVIVDIRSGSPTYAEWRSVELTSENRTMLYVPPGFAHGFQTTADNTEVLYQVSAEYAPSAERGIRWNDPVLNIKWPITDGLTISERDAGLPGVNG